MVVESVVVPFPSRSSLQPAPSSADLVSPGRALLEAQYPLIQEKLHHLSHRSGLPEHEEEEFRSWALLKLLEDDSRVLASWEGRSSFPTFLTVVLVNLMRDYRARIWGKWRPSAVARKQGREAILLERLCFRDGLPLDEAIERMQTEHEVSLSRAELERMAASLTRRMKRWQVSEEELLQIPVDGQVESRIEEAERSVTEDELRVLLTPLLKSLSTENRLLFKLHYWDGLSVAAISSLLGRPQRELYSARNKCLKKIRRSLAKAGLSPERVRELIGCSHLELSPSEF